MRRLITGAAFLCIFSPDAWGEAFYVPAILHGSVRQEIAGVPVHFFWNTAASVPTVSEILPVDLATRPGVLSRTGSAAEVAASAAEFIDLHPEWFRVSSRNFTFLVSEEPRSTGWILNSNQYHQGVLVLGSYAEIWTTTNGGLIGVRARLFPEALLEGLSTDTTVDSKTATETALSSQDGLALLEGPKKVVAFRGTTPFMAWQLEVGDISAGIWLYLIDGTTGEILAVVDEVDTDGPSETRAFVRGDANGDKAIDIADPVSILSLLFLGGTWVSCPDAADLNDDGTLEITDGIHGLNYLFLGGPAPAKPFPNPGPDITRDSLVCPVGR